MISSSLDKVIPPEIIGDTFYGALYELASRPEVRNLLEIGSSSGAGSTEALVSAIDRRSDRELVRLFCMEISRPRFNTLVDRYRDRNFLQPYNFSSVSSVRFPVEAEVMHFYRSVPSNLNSYSLAEVLSWRTQDLEYITDKPMDVNGIEIIRRQNGIQYFDLVLIDGSEFTGERELYDVMGAKYIALDDIRSFKCHAAHSILMSHPNYALLYQDKILRNGFSIFGRQY